MRCFMKKTLLFILSIILVLLAFGVFYMYCPIKKMPLTNDNHIKCIKDNVGLIVGYKLADKEFYGYNTDDNYKYDNDKSSPLDYGIHSYYLQFKEYPSYNQLYEKEYKSMYDLKNGTSFNLAYNNIIIEDTHLKTSAVQRFNFYKTNDIEFPTFKSENIKMIEVLNGMYGNSIQLYRESDSPDNAIYQAIKNEYQAEIIDTIDKQEVINEFLKMYKETRSSDDFSRKNYLSPNVYYRISFKDERFPMWLVCK